ncbi:PREDICTED: eukaryotic translation initiation factor 2-alpha kinase 1-like isoform X2 [Priapulus caudatus]|nr:PREDICTED: eukaryotic translation initiation factor 2-alpha kinase 1-like isoform X2 [Priapulus caudatus]
MLLMLSMTKQLCQVYGGKSSHSMFTFMMEKLSEMHAVWPTFSPEQCGVEPLKSVYDIYSDEVRYMLASARENTLLEQDVILSPLLKGEERINLLLQPKLSDVRQPKSSFEQIFQPSHYQKEFEELQRLGKGGFGRVYKARNKVDGICYAVKKVRFPSSMSESDIRKVMREVFLLAKLRHDNVVGYNAAWLEHTLPGKEPSYQLSYGSSESSQNIVMQTSNTPDCTSDAFLDEGGATLQVCEYSPAPVAGSAMLQDCGCSVGQSTGRPMLQSSECSVAPVVQKTSSSSEEVSSEDGSVIFSPDANSSLTVLDPGQSFLYSPKKSAGRESSGAQCSEQPLQDQVPATVDDNIPPRPHDEETPPRLHDDDHNDISSHWRNGDAISGVFGKRIRRISKSSGHLEQSAEKNARLSVVPVRFQRSQSCEVAPVCGGQTLPRLLHESRVVLFIQMQLCVGTLHDWLRKRNDRCASEGGGGGAPYDVVNQAESMDVLRQLLHGLAYIHEQRLIHRDLKPRNVLLGDAGRVMIGDFGLARDHEVSAEPEACARRDSCCDDLTRNVGTRTYASPEQLSSSNYSSKSDVYSLGVILFELFHPFETGMERLRMLERLREAQGHVPPCFWERWPRQSRCICDMIAECPETRPTAKDLLNSDLYVTPNVAVGLLMKQIHEEREAVRLRDNEIKKKNRELKKLKRLLGYKCREIARKDMELAAQATQLRVQKREITAFREMFNKIVKKS